MFLFGESDRRRFLVLYQHRSSFYQHGFSPTATLPHRSLLLSSFELPFLAPLLAPGVVSRRSSRHVIPFIPLWTELVAGLTTMSFPRDNDLPHRPSSYSLEKYTEFEAKAVMRRARLPTILRF
jgi:hypothetical protein